MYHNIEAREESSLEQHLATGSNVIIYLNTANSAWAGNPEFTSCP